MTCSDFWYCALALIGIAVLPDAFAGEAGQLPLQPTRTVKFSTDEGTWISLDVAPNGKSLVFELLGDLYTLPIGGGRAARITSGMAFDSQPRFSPDGKTIVFVSDRDGAENLWLIDADGRNPRAVSSSKGDMFMSPEWTPDGDSIVVTRSIGSVSAWAWGRETRDLALYLYHSAGAAGIKLNNLTPAGFPRAGAVGFTGAAFGNDSDVLFAAISADSADAEHGLWQIVSFDRQRSVSVQLTDEPGGAMRPLVSPDGRYLIYASRRDDVTQLRLRDQRTGDTRTLLDNVTRDAQRDPDIGRDLMPGSAFLPDGSALVTSFGGRLWRVSVPSGEVTAIPFTAEVEQQLGPLLHFDQAIDDTVTVREIRNAKPSPDGTRLVFSALDRLWLMYLPNGTPRRLTTDDNGEFFPTWSPDGRYIAYATWSELTGGTIKRIRAESGATAETLASDMTYYYEKLAYSPDGLSLFAARSSHRARAEALNEMSMWRDLSPVPLNTELIQLPAEGGVVRSVMPLTAGKVYAPFHGVPHFNRATGAMYIYEYDRGMSSDQSRRPLLTVTGWDEAGGTNQAQEPADDLVISPDGTRALALVNQDLHLIDLPAVAVAQPPTISVDDGSPSPLPIRRITRADGAGPGGDFAGWFPDGKRVYYSLGSTFFIYDLASRRTERVEVNLKLSRDRPSGAVLLRGARLITMNGSEVIENGDLVVVDNRIGALGPRGKVAVPAGARVIDVSGKTIMPGLIDVHAHLWPIWDAHRKVSWEYATSLAYGVTSVRDPQSKRSDALTYADRIDVGDMPGARVFSVGRGVFGQVGLRSLADTRQVLRRYSEHYRTHTIKQYLVGGRMERQWFAMAAQEQRLTPTTEGGKDFKMNLTLILDGYSGLEHWIDTTPLYRDVTELMARSGIAYTLTTNVELDYFYRRYSIHDDAKLRRFVPHAFIDRLPYRARSLGIDDPYLFERHATDAAKIVTAGGRVALGSHGNFPGWGVHWELWATQSGGISPHEGLRVGTLASAEAIGLGRQLGSLEPGKLADLLVLDSNPLLDIRATLSIRYVMKNGRLYESETLNEIWPRNREFGRQSWMLESRSATVH